MLLQEPAPTPYDLEFRCFGFPVRISAWFWLGGLLFGFSLSRSLHELFQEASPGQLPLLLVWMVCLLVSILIHELGHAFAFRRYGIESSIVLYHFGGLAIPRSTARGPSIDSLSAKQDLAIALAGPGLQIATAFLLTALVKFLGYSLTYQGYGFSYWPIDLIPGFYSGATIDSVGLFTLLTFYLLPSFLWALLNLLPVWPLDGGRATHAVVDIRGGARAVSLKISFATAALVAVYALMNNQMYLGIMFGMLAYGNYQMLERISGRLF